MEIILLKLKEILLGVLELKKKRKRYKRLKKKMK